MARPKIIKQEEVKVVLTPVVKPIQTINNQYRFTQSHTCTINNRTFKCQVGDIVELTDFEYSILISLVEPI